MYVKLSSLSPFALTLALVSTFTYASAREFHPMLSSDSRNCYLDAVTDANHSRYQPALAKLESLLMVQPVTVGIDMSTLTSNAAETQAAVAKGVAIWHKALPDSPYVFSTDKQRPQVLIKFVKNLPSDGGDLQGMIEAEHDFKWNGSTHSWKLVSTMYVVGQTEDRSLTPDEISEVVAHELGHLLGLTDAPGPNGLMGPFVPGSPRLAPSASELEAIRELRQMVEAEIEKIDDEL